VFLLQKERENPRKFNKNLATRRTNKKRQKSNKLNFEDAFSLLSSLVGKLTRQ
jgi:hypothetical protein